MWSYSEIQQAAEYCRGLHFIESVRVLPLRGNRQALIYVEIQFTEQRQKILRFEVADPGKRTTPDTRQWKETTDYHGHSAGLRLIPTDDGFHQRSWRLYEVLSRIGDGADGRERIERRSRDIFTETMMKFRLGWHQEDVPEVAILNTMV